MKQLSNKKRKLNYIRQKNTLRLGGKLHFSFKVTSGFYSEIQGEVVGRIQEILIDNIKRYKMLLSFNVETGISGGDFYQELVTVNLTLTKSKP